MATKAEQRRTEIKAFLEANAPCSLDDIVSGCTMPVAEVGRALATLQRSGAVIDAEPGPDGNPRWALPATDEQGDTDNAAPNTDATEEIAGKADGEEARGELGAGQANATQAEESEAAPAASVEPELRTETDSETEHHDVPGTEAPTESGADDGNDSDSGGLGDDAGTEPESAETKEAVPEEDDAEPEPEPVDPDPAILLLAAQLARMEGPFSLESITEASFRVTGPKQLETALHALCALADHGAVECSEPYRPDDRDREVKVEWTVAVDSTEMDRLAGIVQLGDAPASIECATCGSELDLPHPKSSRGKAVGTKSGGKERERLGDGELRAMLMTLIQENPGEEIKPGQFVTELRNDTRFKDKISLSPSGAVRSSLLSLCEPKHGAWVVAIEDRTPLTYYCRTAEEAAAAVAAARR
jgi:hypothetical protein